MNIKFESIGKIKDFPVSDIVGQFIVFKDELQATITDMFHKISYLDSEMILGYVFPLKEEGLLVAKIATGSLDENNMIKMHDVNQITEYKLLPQADERFTVKFSEVADCDFIFTDKLTPDLKEKYYSALPFMQDERMEAICKEKSFDEFRESENPLILNYNGSRFKLINSTSFGFVGKFLENHENYMEGSKALLNVDNNGEISIDGNFSNSENGQIILEILSKLTSNVSCNRKYLKHKFDEYKDNKEVSSIILEKYCKNLQEFDKEIFQSRLTKYNDEIVDKCEQFINISKSGESTKALKLIQEYISNYSCNNDYIIEYMEKDIFREFLDENCYIARQDLSNLFRCYGVIANDNGYKDAALESFKKSYVFNPVNVENLVELAFYYLDIDMDKCKRTIDLGFKYAYTVESIHDLYLVLEEYYQRLGDSERVNAVNDALVGDYELAINLDVPTDFNTEIIQIVLEKLEYHIYQNHNESAIYYLNILMNMRNCHIEDMSSNLEKFLEIEYIDL